MSDLVSRLNSSNYIPEFKNIDIFPLVGAFTHYFRSHKYVPFFRDKQRLTLLANECSFYAYQILISTMVLTPYFNK